MGVARVRVMSDTKPTWFVADIITDPKKYGSRGNEWDPNFVRYMVEIATHDVYQNMPDAIKEDGKIQWEAPSNRSGGLYQFTHQKRLEWWREKAISVGINPNEDKWISRTAKLIHPTKRKICKKCGNEMRLGYCYPNGNLRKRLNKIESGLGDRFINQEITSVVRYLYIEHGTEIFAELKSVFSGAPNINEISDSVDLEDWISWIEETLIPNEWSFLSPGAMSNAPDRFDGFHSFNLCCRKTADKGRSDANLRTYSTDRRVFEFWNGGDWIAADRLMGKFPDSFTRYQCRINDCVSNKLTPDHLGPLSLGFAHRPTFALMCNPHNSGKNNRLTLFDITKLRKHQEEEVVTSWQNHAIWKILNPRVVDEETANRLSKILRDNQRIAMSIIVQISNGGGNAFLSTLLGLHYANFDVEFINLRAVDGVTVFDQLEKSPRDSKQVEKQMLRRLRIAFNALSDYSDKDNRHGWTVEDTWTNEVNRIIDLLAEKEDTKLKSISNTITSYVDGKTTEINSLTEEIVSLTTSPPEHFQVAFGMLMQVLTNIAISLEMNWDSDRYVR